MIAGITLIRKRYADHTADYVLRVRPLKGQDFYDLPIDIALARRLISLQIEVFDE